MSFTNKVVEMNPECGCCAGGCCRNRSCPSEDLPNPLPSSLTIEWTASFTGPPTGNPPGSPFETPENSNCYNFTMTVDLVPAACLDGIVSYSGTGSQTCSWCGTEYTVEFDVVLQCAREGAPSVGEAWLLYLTNPGVGCPIILDDTYRIIFITGSCEPILMSGDMEKCLDCGWQCNLGLWEVAPGVTVPVIVTHAPFCLSALVYETP